MEYLPTFALECGHFSPNVGKYSLHGASGICLDPPLTNQNSMECHSRVFSNAAHITTSHQVLVEPLEDFTKRFVHWQVRGTPGGPKKQGWKKTCFPKDGWGKFPWNLLNLGGGNFPKRWAESSFVELPWGIIWRWIQLHVWNRHFSI